MLKSMAVERGPSFPRQQRYARVAPEPPPFPLYRAPVLSIVYKSKKEILCIFTACVK